MRLMGELAVLLGVYKLPILAVGDCLTDVSTILVFVCKNRVILAEFQHIDGSARWLTSFNFNHTLKIDHTIIINFQSFSRLFPTISNCP